MNKTLKPKTLDELIGQADLKRKARIAIGAALQRGGPLPHTLLTSGSGGLGKTKVTMDLARHSDINLTMGRYSHTVLEGRAEALQKLPDLREKRQCQKTERPHQPPRLPTLRKTWRQTWREGVHLQVRGCHQMSANSASPFKKLVT
jgi:hypothetical protein